MAKDGPDALRAGFKTIEPQQRVKPDEPFRSPAEMGNLVLQKLAVITVEAIGNQ